MKLKYPKKPASNSNRAISHELRLAPALILRERRAVAHETIITILQPSEVISNDWYGSHSRWPE